MRYIVLFFILLIVWLVLTFDLTFPNLLVGALAAIITTVIFGPHFVRDVRKFFQPQRYLWLLIFLIVFVWECLKANFDVAYRVLHPAMPIKPGIVKVKLNLKSDIAKTILANAITMTPGTISVDLVDDILYVHWIYVSSFDPEIYSHKVAGRFEKYIKRIFD
ncbi:MAG: Na+/H+ antiporter subunit E [Bacteroidales bacterium]|nr:Na+/H+ antiporter subunit E [Bacteroidales bacterium]MBN2762720.1 Na+/H+ antiporter subunit E [Bacteroidales bacterium]